VGKLFASPASLHRSLAVTAGGAHADASKVASKAVVPSMNIADRAGQMAVRRLRSPHAPSSSIAKVCAAGSSAVSRAVASKAGTATLLGARQYHLTVKSKWPWHNKSIDTDPCLQKAASPQMAVVRSFLR
jgi:acetyl-CoA acetyltransferase